MGLNLVGFIRAKTMLRLVPFLLILAAAVSTRLGIASAVPAAEEFVRIQFQATLAPTLYATEPALTAPISLTMTLTPTATATPTRSRTATPTHSPTPYPIPSGSSTRLDVTFHSPALGTDGEMIVYLPPGYNVTVQRRYPVLYLLHGWGGSNLKHTTEWEQWGLQQGVQEAILKGVSRPIIVVQPLAFMPNGECSLFFNHGPGTDGKAWGDFIWNDVVHYVDSTYRTLPRRESRAIGGFSFGGQGALSLGLTHPEIFRVVGGHSPSFRQADGSIDFMNDPEWFDQFDPVWLVKNTDTAKQLSIWLDVATGDDKVRICGPGSDHCVEAFHALLNTKGIAHAWHDQWPGPHEGTYWQGHLEDYLAWYSSQLVGE